MLLEEYDNCQNAVIEPSDMIEAPLNMPEIVVATFDRNVFNRMLTTYEGIIFAKRSAPNMISPIYRVTYGGKNIAITLMDVGAPACVSFCEELYSMGAQMIILFGTCGVLDRRIGSCSIIIPNKAIRDEGTSYHYLPPFDELSVNTEYFDDFIFLLNENKIPYFTGKVWTTDALYRETHKKIERRKEQGCICVDMECSAVAAMAKFRRKHLFHFFYAADNLDAPNWEERSLSNNLDLSRKGIASTIAMIFATKIHIHQHE